MRRHQQHPVNKIRRSVVFKRYDIIENGTWNRLGFSQSISYCPVLNNGTMSVSSLVQNLLLNAMKTNISKDAMSICKEKMTVSDVIQFSTYAVLFAIRMVVCWTCSFIFRKSFVRKWFFNSFFGLPPNQQSNSSLLWITCVSCFLLLFFFVFFKSQS